MSINPDFKAKWVAALRSGKYKQARGDLRNEVGYCCIGVACDLIDPDAWEFGPSVFRWRGQGGDMPDDARVQIGLSLAAQAGAIAMNDDREQSFSEIADWIEQYA